MENLNYLSNSDLVELYEKACKCKEKTYTVCSKDWSIEELKTRIYNVLCYRNMFDDFVKDIYEMKVDYKGGNEIIDETLEKVKVEDKDEVYDIVVEGSNKILSNVKDATLIEFASILLEKLRIYLMFMPVESFKEHMNGNLKIVVTILNIGC